MSKNKTPLLRTLRKNGSTLYVFPSASEDIGLNLNNGSNGVAMSHFALLNFTKENFKFTSDTDIVGSLLNYAMNCETTIINDENYNYQEYYTVSEHVFWKWLRKNGFEIKNSSMSNIMEDKNVGNKNRLVQCFGAIDAGSSLSTEFGMFNETYVLIPTSYGNGPVFFREVDDNSNYQPNHNYTASNQDGYLENRKSNEFSYIQSSPVTAASYDNAANHTYVDDKPIEIVKDIPTIQAAVNAMTGNADVSSFDDINIDPDGLLNSTAYNMSGICEFKFNAILLYYSIYNNDDVKKEALATNLFGIVFLDGGNSNDETYYLTPITKKKSFKGNGQNQAYFGNSYSFRVNIKSLSVYDNTDATIQDNSTITNAYSVDFNDVISNLNKAIDTLNTNVRTTAAIQDAYMTISSYYINTQQTLSNFQKQVEATTNDYVENALLNLSAKLDEKFIELGEKLGILERSEDGSTEYVVKDIEYSSSQNANVYNAGRSSEATDDGEIVANKVNISSVTETNIKSNKNVNLTGKDIVFNITDNGETVATSFNELISQINDIVEYINSSVHQTYASEAPVEEKSSNTEELVIEKILAVGIIPIIDILEPRVKPEQNGYYLKKNTSGNILNYIYYNGTYIETFKCESGKMYSKNGLIYVFDGETCKLLGL